MTGRLARPASYAAAVVLITITGCSDGDSAPRARQTASADQATGATATASGPSPRTSASAPPAVPTATAVPAPGTTVMGLPSRTDPTPTPTAAPGPRARARAAAAGSYALRVTGSFRTGSGERPVEGTGTLTVDPPTGDDQRSSLTAGRGGSTEQTVRFGPTATELVRLTISAPPFTKEFRPVRPVVLLPEPPTVGRRWSWTVVSTDGATTAALEAEVVRRETVVVGGERVACVVVHSTLRLSGDITATSVIDTWYSERYRLRAKDHTVTDGTFGGYAFHSDTTTALQSTKPA